MTKDKGLRLFIEEIFKARIEYKEVGNSFIEYLNDIYLVYLVILQSLIKDKKEGKLNRRKNEEIKDVVLTNIVDLSIPLSMGALKSGLDRINLKYESFPAKYTVESVVSVLAKIRKGATFLLTMASIASAILGVVVKYMDWKQKKQIIASKILSDKYGKEVYRMVVYPELVKIIEDITKMRISDEKGLRDRFYKATERMGKASPALKDYFKAWAV